jgi:thermostable 8-oxoguanine DNA glycosylase
LLKRFEEVISATGRTIKESYSSWYRENENQLSSARRVSSDRDNAESSEDDRGVDSLKRVAFIGARPEPQNTVPDPVFTIDPVTANQIHLQNDIKPFLDFYSPENAQLSADDAPLAISELDEAGNPTAYFKDRVVTIRVGFLLAAIRNLGLIGEFEDLLAVSGRIINPRYEQMYQQNMSAIAASSKHNLPLSRVVDEPSLTRIPSHPKEIIEITESKEYLQRQYYLHSSDINLQLQACSDRAQAMVRNDIFKYLCLNLLSVNADWDTAMAATEQLDEDGHLFKGGVDAVKLSLKSAKYRGRGKADWLVEARHRYYEEGHPRFSEPIEVLIGRLRNTGSPLARRAHIKKLVSGLGMKTASHFLRGVNLSDNKLAILDSHVLKQLLTFPEIASKIRHVVQINDKGIPKHPSDTRYLDIEKAVIDWATHQVGIPMDALDLLLWRLGRSGAR